MVPDVGQHKPRRPEAIKLLFWIIAIGAAGVAALTTASIMLMNRSQGAEIAGWVWLAMFGGGVWVFYGWASLTWVIGRLVKNGLLAHLEGAAGWVALSLMAFAGGTYLTAFTAGPARGWGIFLTAASPIAVWWVIQAARDARDAAERIKRAEAYREEQMRAAANLAEEQRLEALQRAEEQWNRRLADFEGRWSATERGASFRVSGETLLGILTWDELERAVAALLEQQGWSTRVSPSGPDRGVDILASHSTGLLLAVQVKHWKQGRVGRPILQQLVGSAMMAGANEALCVSSGGFSQDALDFVRDISQKQASLELTVEIWDRVKIAHLIDTLDQPRYDALTTSFKQRLAKQAERERKEIEREKSRRWRAKTKPNDTATTQQRQLDYLNLTGRKAPTCDRCGSQMRLRRGRNYFFGCSKYPACRRTVDVPTT
ncbi:MAG: restriction endonuclease [Chloroflexi bacterium]|nr:restriction endonuclease [Chloroflexota bacterium]